MHEEGAGLQARLARGAGAAELDVEVRLRVLSAAVEQSPVSILITDPEGRIEYVNPMFCRVTGYEAGEVLGQSPRLLSSGRMGAGFYGHLWRTVTEGRIWQGEFVNRRKDGSEYWEQATISPIVDDRGGILHFVGVKEDVTARKRSLDEREHLLAALERRVGALQCLNDISGALQRLAGLEDVFWEVLRLLPAGWSRPALVRVIYDETEYALPGFRLTPFCQEAPLRVAEELRGRLEVVCLEEAPFLQEERELLETVARMLGQNLHRRETEAQLRQAQAAAAEANRAKSLFLANMSHEIRTPLNAILGFSEILYRDPALGEAQREKLGIVNRSGTYLLALINDILELSKLESGRVVLQPSPFELRRLLRDVESLFQTQLRQKGLQLQLRLAEPLPPQVLGDEGKVRQILLNLVGNALKFTDRGGVAVELDGEPQADGRWRLRLRVRDSGIGIAPEDQEAIFGYFEQGHHRRHDRGGTGLGLAISREFARRMGGDITVASRLGQGAEFEVTLLLAEAQTAAAPQPPGLAEAARTGGRGAWAPEEPPCLSWQGGCVLAAPLRRELQEATLNGDVERLEELLAAVAQVQPELAAHARELAEGFRLDALARLWEEGGESDG